MPTRVSHKKSRLGCKRCKARRVKCDEVHPSCANCARHGVSCEYENPFASKGAKQHYDVLQPYIAGASYPSPEDRNLAATPGRSSLTPRDTEQGRPFQSSADGRRQLELRLLHHFSTTVAFTLALSMGAVFRTVWSVDLVRLAFEHDFLLNAIFSISALHLYRSSPPAPCLDVPNDTLHALRKLLNTDRPPDMGHDALRAHFHYLDLAVKQQREAATNLSPENSNALFFTSILLSFQTTCQPDRGEELQAGPYLPPVQWLRMMSGMKDVTSVVTITFPHHKLAAWLFMNDGAADFNDLAAIFNPENAIPFAEYLDWDKHPEPELDEDTKSTYKHTLYYIGGIHKAIRDQEAYGDILRRILAFSPMVPKRFVNLVELLRPRALVLLALFCSLIKTVDNHWLYHGFAHREVMGIQSILPADWQWGLEKPLQLMRQLTPFQPEER